VWVNSFGNEVIVEVCLLGIVFVNIDLPKLAASTNLDDARTGVDKPLFALSVAFLDDSVEVIHEVRLILNRQGSGPLIGGQTFLQCELGVFLPVRGPASRAPSTAFSEEHDSRPVAEFRAAGAFPEVPSPCREQFRTAAYQLHVRVFLAR